MLITKEDVIKLMRSTIEENWINPSMVSISQYERAISILSNENNQYEGREDDWKTIMHYIGDYSDFKIENVYQIIYKHQPFNFMKVMR